MEETITSAESVLANLKTFALETQNPEAKQMFKSLAKSQQGITDTLNSRLEFIKNEEPQFRGQ
ncbi:hypothetical protein U472_02095 [Orenia metallireducens]|jgi:hypothetical protein|uniref:DUF1657 domain-containing protein n=2 Tax=Orenia metallireducens TaxID=1413210 RepID=A0A1C0ACQ3_9FIRM|nr:hypothetical protein U472_02095 [Orenia metallireducens]